MKLNYKLVGLIGVILIFVVLGVIKVTLISKVKTAEQLGIELEAAGEYELKYGCTQLDTYGRLALCGDSRKRIDMLEAEYQAARSREEARSQADMDIVTSNIRAMSENPNAEIILQGRFNNPYTDVIKKKVEYYKDDRGIIYLVDPDTLAIVQFTDESVNDSTNPLSMNQLRERAEAYLIKHVPDFIEMKEVYKSEEGMKGSTMVVFRWNALERVNGEQRLPFVQIKLAPNGRLIGFSDTRILYK